MRPGPSLELYQLHVDGHVWLTVTGELDVATAPRLAERLHQLRDEHRTVVVDLSGVQFMDSSGLHVLLDAIEDAQSGRWTLEVRDDLSPQVRRLFELMGFERFIFPRPAPVPATPAASRGRGSPLDAGHTRTGDPHVQTMTRAGGRS